MVDYTVPGFEDTDFNALGEYVGKLQIGETVQIEFPYTSRGLDARAVYDELMHRSGSAAIWIKCEDPFANPPIISLEVLDPKTVVEARITDDKVNTRLVRPNH